VNNVYVSAANHGFDPGEYIRAIPAGAVLEIHLAGHDRVDGLLIDTHGTTVADPVWSLYAEAVARFPDAPALVEWDSQLPALDVLLAEAAKAERLREQIHAIAA
jgi:uncharacterized protein (UPF0276 family)